MRTGIPSKTPCTASEVARKMPANAKLKTAPTQHTAAARKAAKIPVQPLCA